MVMKLIECICEKISIHFICKDDKNIFCNYIDHCYKVVRVDNG